LRSGGQVFAAGWLVSSQYADNWLCMQMNYDLAQAVKAQAISLSGLQRDLATVAKLIAYPGDNSSLAPPLQSLATNHEWVTQMLRQGDAQVFKKYSGDEVADEARSPGRD
jgi:hypothetical protein